MNKREVCEALARANLAIMSKGLAEYYECDKDAALLRTLKERIERGEETKIQNGTIAGKPFYLTTLHIDWSEGEGG